MTHGNSANFEYTRSENEKYVKVGIIWMRGRKIEECIISAVSGDAAELSLAVAQLIPTEFYLIDTAAASIYHVKKAWCSSRDIGVQIIGRATLAIV